MAVETDDLLKQASSAAALLGLGALVAAPFLLKSSQGRPVAKSIVHGCLDVADRLGEAAAETAEQWQDLVAEVRAERMAKAASKAAETVKA